MTAVDWEKSTVQRIGRQIKAMRRQRAWSAQSLADRTSELGYPIGRATLSQLENGARKAPTVPELLVIAAALNTSPLMLVFGEQLADGPIEALPGVNSSAAEALLWFAGWRPLPDVVDQDAFEESVAPGSLVYSRYSSEVSMQHPSKDPEFRRWELGQIADLNQRMIKRGMVVNQHGDD